MPFKHGIKAVLFDLDGTLINSMEADTLSLQYLMHDKLGLDISNEKMKTYLGLPTKTILREFVPEAEIESRFVDWLEVKQKFCDRIMIFPEILSLLEDLQRTDILTAVVTSQFELESAIIRKHFSLQKFFNVWITSDISLRHKPDPAPVHAALKSLSIQPGQAIMIGDTTFDIDAGQSAGTLTGAALWGARDKSALMARNPNYIFNNPKDIKSIIEMQPWSF